MQSYHKPSICKKKKTQHMQSTLKQIIFLHLKQKETGKSQQRNS